MVGGDRELDDVADGRLDGSVGRELPGDRAGGRRGSGQLRGLCRRAPHHIAVAGRDDAGKRGDQEEQRDEEQDAATGHRFIVDDGLIGPRFDHPSNGSSTPGRR
jgi:hypothetical protein